MADEIKKNNKHLINAPAGSGKTTYIRNQLKSICINKPESRILCITYTNRAADELKKDLENANITVSTIHSYINDLISPFYSHKEVLDLYCEIYAEKINERIANVTNDEHIKQSNQYYTEKYGKLTEKAVRENLLEISYGETPFTSLYTGKLSHDDLLMFASKLIKRYPVLLKKIGDKYNYIFIDEYQDTSSYVLDIFYDAVKNRENVQIYLFGDRMQQIYRNYDGSFEGKLKEFDTSDRLEVNFRSIGKIVSILNNIYNDSSFEQQGKVIYKQLDRIQQLIEKMEPTDIRVKHRECYLGNRCLFDKGNYANRWKMLEDKKLSVVKEIFDEYGSEEVERFGCAVKNVHDVANKLGRFLRPNEMSSIIEKYFIGILSKEFTINCLISFVYTQGAEKLLETSLCQMEDEFMLEILSKIPFSLQLLDVINQVLDDDTAYWEKGAMPYSCYDAEELKIIVEKLVACKRYVTAVNIIGHSECEAVINAECIYKLMKLAGTEESIGVETLDDYAVQKIIGWFQQQEDIDLELRSDIEFIYLPMLDEYSEVRPRALNTRLSLEPEYFCSLIELFYKERNGEKREIELNKSLSDRLYEILFQFKVIPGIDWNGNFDAKRFDYWMKTVKTWSRDNDRYEVAMHTVGSGLSYAELDEDKLPQTAIIEELNRVENEELRRGYYLGIINQRGVHWIDPEGKPELELAEDYENKANIAESRGYSRYAGILRGVADEFKREAKSNILEAKNGDDE